MPQGLDELKDVKGDELEELLARSSRLPSLESIFELVQNLLSVGDADFTRLFDAFDADQALPEPVLRLLRAQRNRIPESVQSLPEAVAYLGAKSVRDLALSLGFVSKLREVAAFGQGNGFLWRTCLMNGIAARLLAGIGSDWDSDEAFLTGLVADCGVVVMYGLVPEYADLFVQFRRGDTELIELERANFGTDHARVSQRLLSVWNFEEEICEIVAAHHSSDTLASDQRLYNRARVLEAAWVCARSLTVPGYAWETPWLSKRCAELLPISEEDTVNIETALHEEFETDATVFRVPLGDL